MKKKSLIMKLLFSHETQMILQKKVAKESLKDDQEEEIYIFVLP